MKRKPQFRWFRWRDLRNCVNSGCIVSQFASLAVCAYRNGANRASRDLELHYGRDFLFNYSIYNV